MRRNKNNPIYLKLWRCTVLLLSLLVCSGLGGIALWSQEDDSQFELAIKLGDEFYFSRMCLEIQKGLWSIITKP